MRISDWSSDVCSSDLAGGGVLDQHRPVLRLLPGAQGLAAGPDRSAAAAVGRGYAPDSSRFAAAVGKPILPNLPLKGRASGHGRRACCRRRSEEHTSELQSLMRISYAVFCLKKKSIVTVLSNLHINKNKIK